MATNVSTVSLSDTSSATQGNGAWYQSFEAWEAAQRDLTGTDGEDVLFYDEWPGGLATSVVVDWAGTAENTTPIRFLAADPEKKYDPITQTGSYVSQGSSYDNAFEIAANVYVEFIDIGIICGSRRCISTNQNTTASTQAVKVIRCYLQNAGAVNTRYTMFSARNVKVKVESSILRFTNVDFPLAGALAEDMRGASDGEVTNTLLIHDAPNGNPYYATAATGSSVNWRNVVLFNSDLSDAYTQGSIAGGTDYTAVTGTGLPTGEANGITGLTKSDFENFDLGDFHPAAAGLLRGAGTATVLPRDDFDALPFLSPPSVGAYEFVGAGPVPPSVTVDDTSGQAGTPIQQNATVTAGTGTGLTYAWIIQSGPGGGTFSDSAIEDPTFTPDTDGLYVLQCTVTTSDGSDVDTGNCTVTGVITLDPDSVTTIGQIDNVALTQLSTITPNPVTTIGQIDNVTIIGGGVDLITPDTITTQGTIDNVTLAGGTFASITPNTITTQGQVGFVALSGGQPYTVSPEDVTTQGIIDSVTLSQQGELAVLDAVTQGTIDNVVVTVSYTVTPDDLTTQGITWNVVVSQDGEIVPATLGTLGTIDNVILTQRSTIAPDTVTTQGQIGLVRFSGLAEGTLEGEIMIYPSLTGNPIIY